MADLHRLRVYRNWLLSLPETPSQEQIPAVERAAGDMHSYIVSLIPRVLRSSVQWQICTDYVCAETGCFHYQKLPHKRRFPLEDRLPRSVVRSRPGLA